MSFCLLPLGCELDSAITLSTRMLILCNPSNPTGSVYSAEQLEALAEVKRSVLACHATWLQRHAAWLPRHGTWLQRGCRGTERGCSVVAAAWNMVLLLTRWAATARVANRSGHTIADGRALLCTAMLSCGASCTPLTVCVCGVAKVLRKHPHVFVLSDEIYEKITYVPLTCRMHHAPHAAQRTTHCMPRAI